MDANEKQSRLEAFEKSCRENGIPCTHQRRAILEVVLDSDTHPSVNLVFDAAKAVSPGISRATVHRNLEIMARMGVITKTCHPGGVMRFDARTDIHHHLICLRCDSVVDVDDDTLNTLKIPDTSAFGFEVSDFRVQLRGICKNCSEAEAKRLKKG
jgi:Fur family peroxide stress response transcriptional regulator